GIVGEEDVVLHPCRGALRADHRAQLAAQVAEVLRVEEHEGHAGADAELEIAHLDADLLERADAADIKDAKIGDLEPLLAEVPRGFLECIEKVDTELRRLSLEFEEAGTRQGTAAAGLVAGQAHHSAAAAGENADIGTEETRNAVNHRRDAFRLGVGESDGATVEREDGRLLEPALLLLSDEEPVILLVGVQVEIAELRSVPIGVEAERGEMVEPGVGGARGDGTGRSG